jgi:hypothetical protein
MMFGRLLQDQWQNLSGRSRSTKTDSKPEDSPKKWELTMMTFLRQLQGILLSKSSCQMHHVLVSLILDGCEDCFPEWCD